MFRITGLLSLVLILFVACTPEPPELENFDQTDFSEIMQASLDDLNIGSLEKVTGVDRNSFITLDRTANRLHLINDDGSSETLRLELPAGTDITSITTDQDGRFYVLDAYGGNMHILEEGDEQWVKKGEITFDDYVTEMPRTIDVGRDLIYIKSFAHGGAEDGQSTGKLYTFDHEGNPVTEEPVEFPIRDLTSDPLRQAGVPVPVPFSNTTLFAANSEGLAFLGWTESLELTGYTTDGLQDVQISLGFDPVPADTEDMEEWLETMDPELQTTIESSMPEYLPVMHNLVISDQNEIWIQVQIEGSNANTLVFTPEGDPLSYLELPPDFEIEDVRANRVAGIERDATGEQSLRIFEVD